MKLLLLFVQNISYKLVERLKDLYPESTHVRLEKLDTANDDTVWEYAKLNSYTIVSQDGDFFDLGLLKGSPPKVIWLRCGNTSTSFIESLLRENFEAIKDFIVNQPETCLEIV